MQLLCRILLSWCHKSALITCVWLYWTLLHTWIVSKSCSIITDQFSFRIKLGFVWYLLKLVWISARESLLHPSSCAYKLAFNSSPIQITGKYRDLHCRCRYIMLRHTFNPGHCHVACTCDTTFEVWPQIKQPFYLLPYAVHAVYRLNILTLLIYSVYLSWWLVIISDCRRSFNGWLLFTTPHAPLNSSRALLCRRDASADTNTRKAQTGCKVSRNPAPLPALPHLLYT